MSIKNIILKTILLSSSMLLYGCTDTNNNNISDEVDTSIYEDNELENNTKNDEILEDFTEVLDGENINIDTILKKQDNEFDVTHKFGMNYSETKDYAITIVDLKKAKSKKELLNMAKELKNYIENDYKEFDKYNFKFYNIGDDELLRSINL